MFKSIGESSYNAFTLTLAQADEARLAGAGDLHLARGDDNAPLTGTYVIGSHDDRVSDPYEPRSR